MQHKNKNKYETNDAILIRTNKKIEFNVEILNQSK